MFYNGTGHEIYLLNQSELYCSKGDEFKLKDEVEIPTILNTIEKDIKLNIHLSNSIDPYVGEVDEFNIYISDIERMYGNIDIPENFIQYSKIIVSSTYANRILQYCLCYPNIFPLEYLNKLYVVSGKVRHNSKVIGCIGLKKVIPGNHLDFMIKYTGLEHLDQIDLSELVIAIKRFRTWNGIENQFVSKDVLYIISEYINKNGVKYDLELNKIYK